MPEPSGSTGAEPSAEAIEAAADIVRRLGSPWTFREEADAQSVLAAAYRIDAPAIHAAGRDEALREVVERTRQWIGEQRPADASCHEYHEGRAEQLDRLTAFLDGLESSA